MTVPRHMYIHFQPHLGLYLSFHGAAEYQVRLACSRVKFMESLVDFGLAMGSRFTGSILFSHCHVLVKSVWKPQRPS